MRPSPAPGKNWSCASIWCLVVLLSDVVKEYLYLLLNHPLLYLFFSLCPLQKLASLPSNVINKKTNALFGLTILSAMSPTDFYLYVLGL